MDCLVYPVVSVYPESRLVTETTNKVGIDFGGEYVFSLTVEQAQKLRNNINDALYKAGC